MSSLWKDHAAVNALFATAILVAVTVAGAGVVMTTTEPFKSTNMEHHDEQVISVRQQGNRVDLINNGPRVLEVQDTWVRVVENGEHKVHRPTDLMEDATPGSEPSQWLVGDLLCVSCLYDHADIDSLTVSHGEHTIFHQHFHIPEAIRGNDIAPPRDFCDLYPNHPDCHWDPDWGNVSVHPITLPAPWKVLDYSIQDDVITIAGGYVEDWGLGDYRAQSRLFQYWNNGTDYILRGTRDQPAGTNNHLIGSTVIMHYNASADVFDRDLLIWGFRDAAAYANALLGQSEEVGLLAARGFIEVYKNAVISDTCTVSCDSSYRLAPHPSHDNTDGHPYGGGFVPPMQFPTSITLTNQLPSDPMDVPEDYEFAKQRAANTRIIATSPYGYYVYEPNLDSFDWQIQSHGEFNLLAQHYEPTYTVEIPKANDVRPYEALEYDRANVGPAKDADGRFLIGFGSWGTHDFTVTPPMGPPRTEWDREGTAYWVNTNQDPPCSDKCSLATANTDTLHPACTRSDIYEGSTGFKWPTLTSPSDLEGACYHLFGDASGSIYEGHRRTTMQDNVTYIQYHNARDAAGNKIDGGGTAVFVERNGLWGKDARGNIDDPLCQFCHPNYFFPGGIADQTRVNDWSMWSLDNGTIALFRTGNTTENDCIQDGNRRYCDYEWTATLPNPVPSKHSLIRFHAWEQRETEWEDDDDQPGYPSAFEVFDEPVHLALAQSRTPNDTLYVVDISEQVRNMTKLPVKHTET